jgi:CubicO group peptidase (beta-lactamase class C family)
MITRTGLLSLAFAIALAPPALALGAADKAHIRDIENNLLPAMIVKNRPSQVMTLPQAMAATHVPGVSIAFFENGRIVWAKAYGFADATTRRPVSTETMFQAGSISKPVSAMAAMKLVQDGTLNLDEDVNARLKAWRVPDNALDATEKVTLRRLLSHTAGLTVHGFQGYVRGTPIPTLPQILNGTAPANSPPVVVAAKPGSAWSYSGGGYVVAQLLMQEATGMRFAELMQKTVLGPVGMTHSTYEQPLPEALAGRAALAHTGNGVPTEGGWNVYPEQTAAGLWTTPSDLAMLMIEVQNELAGTSHKVLDQKTAQLMLTPVMANYGLGWGVPPDGRFGHDGQNVGFNDSLIAFRSGTRQGVAIMTNGDGGALLEQKIMRAVAKTYGWTGYPTEEFEAVSVDPAVLARLTGIYDVAGLAKITFTNQGDRFFVATPVLGPEAMEAYMSSPTAFFVPDAGLSGAFNTGADGKIASVALKSPVGNFEAKRLP